MISATPRGTDRDLIDTSLRAGELLIGETKGIWRSKMLTTDDNQLMCRVGPGTPMGDLMRQYWIPALLPGELPTPDCPPIRLRLLGENLIAFRVTSGKVGIIENNCPHRGTSLI